MSALFDSLASAFASGGDARRRAQFDAALRDGLPGPRSERWKYTSLRALERRSFAVAPDAAPPVDAALLADIPAPRLVFVNGRLDAALSHVETLPADLSVDTGTDAHDMAAADAAVESDGDAGTPGDDVFARVNAALAREGVRVQVNAGAHVDAPLQLVFVGASTDADLAWHLRHRIVLGAGASLCVVEHHLASGAHRHLDTSALRIDVAEGATLEHARVQQAADGATLFTRTEATLQRDSVYRRVDLELGGALSRHELDVRLVGDRALLAAHGVLLAAGRTHLDTRLGIEHLARDTRCELLWRGIGAGRGRAVFHGGITIHPGADGTDARLSNKNLLLSATAEIDTQPVLVIHADEVQAAHGATVGELDPNALFYLRARGLPQPQAKQLLTAAFCREPLAAVADATLRETLTALIDAALDAVTG
ncbi:Fe-S cluster assembly protein SufD [Luteimonas kalidii]|uniref:Fe-S cluster assembly protein SufD n=1 Tax=Luteimonas kalidii TaxID=3042025 RepID=A0ABT6JXN0_9GAMM|nr:Fe-S cluster assembly protein SufD [Luteimonas kalidii]MDH5835463.1 Fe-S cluster assembly protein SufD [Luteimonas kalidii]